MDAALQASDAAEILRLLEAAQPLLPNNLYLEQWCIFARACLAIYGQLELDDAIVNLESLRNQTSLAPNLLARALNVLGIVYELKEQWDRALHCYDECREIYRAAQDDFGLGRVLLNQAIVYVKAQDYAAAADCAWQSIELFERNQVDAKWQLRLGKAWNQYGIAQMDLGRLEQAQAAFERCLAILARWDERWGQGYVYQNLAEVHQKLGQVTQAKAYFLRARDALQETGNTRQLADVIYRLGALEMQNAAPLEAVQPFFDEALRLARAADNYEIVTHIFLSRAEWQERQGDPSAALEETRRAVETVELLRANIVLPDDRARMTASRVQAYEQMVRRLCSLDTASNYAQAFYYAELSKSRTLIELLAGRPLRPPQRVPLEWLEKEAQLRQSLHQLYQDANAPHEQIASLEVELDQLRERIRLQDAEFVSFQTANPLTLDEVQARLPEDTVLLEYFTTGKDILAFVVTPRQLAVKRLPLQVQELQSAFRRVGDQKLGPLHNLTRSEGGNLRPPWILHNLYQRLVEPLGPIIQLAQTLCIVPHGLLHYVPFHALCAKTGERTYYLVERGTELQRIVYAPSATILLDYCQHKPASRHTGCLALGYNGNLLAQAEMEATQVVQITGGKSRVGPEATRQALLAEGANYGYIHLSCHGWFNATWPLLSSLNLADGTLDVADVLRELRLDATLVCLSACETGRSHIMRGDELIGLARAFLYAGTSSVLVSQWVVGELSTRLLMESFYRELIEHHLTPSEAISRAQGFIRNLTYDELRQMLLASSAPAAEIERQLQYLATAAGYGSTKGLRGDERLFAHPYYWAPFFLIGERFAA